MIPGAPVKNVKPTQSPIVINLPDGSQIRSTHTCELDNPALPAAARQAHIVPGLAHTSLISIKMLCDAGCIVKYDAQACTVYYNKKIVWVGKRDKSTGLWILAIQANLKRAMENPQKSSDARCRTESTQHQANNAYHMTSKQELIQYLHQCLFCPPKRTLIKAIQNNQL